MTERSMGADFKWFVAKVVNRGDGNQGDKDETESGRVQIRIYGKHDDEKNIPDNYLPWAIPLISLGGPFGGPNRNGVGAAPVGLQKDTQVVGFYADKDESIPIIFGILTRAGKDSGNEGTTVSPENNDVPKGARTTATQGGDKNDALPNNPAITEDQVAKKDQLHVNIPTIGAEPFDGTKVLDVINKADPSNLSGSISSALNGAKSMLNTLNSASSLLSNFSSIASGGIPNLNSLISLGAKAAGLAATAQSVASAVNQINSLSNSIPLAPAAQISQAVNLISSGKYPTSNPTALINQIKSNPAMAMNVIQQAIGAANMVANAFSGGNPMATILGALGGVDGLKSIASQAQSLIGPLTGTFGAATAISGMLKGMGNNIFSNVKEIPIPKITNALNVVNNLNNIGNIAGVGVGNVGNLVNAITNSPISSLLAQSPLNAALNASNLLNSSIPLPSFVQSASVINSISSTSINNILNTSQNSLLNSIVGTTTQLNAALNAAALHNSAITLPSSINPSNYTRMINRNTGVNVSINPSPAPAVILPVNISNVSNTNNSYTSSTVIRNVNIVSPGYNINSLLNSTINVNIPPALTINSINKVLNNNPGVNYDVTGTVFKVLK